MDSLRILHIPGHTPFARKLRSERFAPVNGTSHPLQVPLAASIRWLLDMSSWDFFDIVHLHTVELFSFLELENCIKRLALSSKGLVFTIHDLIPNIELDQIEFHRKTRLVIAAVQRPSTLTRWACSQLCQEYNLESSQIEVIPHGYVFPPANHRSPYVGDPAHVISMYGALRPNRSVDGAIEVCRRAVTRSANSDTMMKILIRSISRVDAVRYGSTFDAISQLLREGVPTEIRLFTRAATDEEVVGFCSTSSALFLPYLWTSHSGQLELAWDLGIPIFAPRLAGLLSQTEFHQGAPMSICWFDPSLLRTEEGRGILAELIRETLLQLNPTNRTAFELSYRAIEHEAIIKRYGDLYRHSISI